MSRVIAITGPTGSGKTTVAELLANSQNNFVNIDADHIKHMNPNAFKKTTNDDGSIDWPYSEWSLVGQNIGLLAKNFVSHDYDVIINGYLEVGAWIEIEKLIEINSKLLLSSDLETNLHRNNSRSNEIKMNDRDVIRGRTYFSKEKYYKDFMTIDSTNQTVKETAKHITNII